MDLVNDNYCFACGRDNPVGLKMDFEFDGDKALCRFTPGREYQGWSNIIHGGILFTLMDEIMAQLLIKMGHSVVTSRLDTRFLRPAGVGEELTVVASFENFEGKNYYANSKITNAKGKIIASSRGVYAKIRNGYVD